MPEPAASASIETHLPLKPAVFQILLALADRERHGYSVLLAVRESSGGRIRLETGPLYRHLKKLLDCGLVREFREESPQDPRRGCRYALTDLGRQVLRAESARLDQALSLSRRLGLLEGAGG